MLKGISSDILYKTWSVSMISWRCWVCDVVDGGYHCCVGCHAFVGRRPVNDLVGAWHDVKG